MIFNENNDQSIIETWDIKTVRRIWHEEDFFRGECYGVSSSDRTHGMLSFTQYWVSFIFAIKSAEIQGSIRRISEVPETICITSPSF